MSAILITGSASGLGLALYSALLPDHTVIPYDNMYNVLEPYVEDINHLDVLINCAGVNKIDWLENFTEEDWDKVMDTNAKGIFMMIKACLPLLIKSKGTIVNIVSNASHMPMRCSLAYNASKGAAHIMTQQLARELTPKHGITVFGVSPNKMSGTKMSAYIDEAVQTVRGMTAEEAQQYQKQSLLVGEETPPRAVAEFITYLLSTKNNHKYLSGCVLQYGA